MGCLQAEVWGNKSFVRLDKISDVQIVQEPAYVFGEFKTIPSDNSFLPFPKDVSANNFPWTTKISECWIKWSLENKGNSKYYLALRLNRGAGNFCLYRRGNDGIEKFTTESKLSKDSLGQPFYKALMFELPPGKYDFILSTGPIYYKSGISNIDILFPKELKNDRFELLNNETEFVFVLFTFNAFIIFQLLYILIQWLYHRRIEYLNYLCYLICIELYFGLRFELVYSIPILSDIHPGMNQYLSSIMLFLPYYFYLEFTRHYINMDELYPKVNRIVINIERLILLYLVPVFVLNYLGYQKLIGQFSLVFLLVIYVCTLWLINFFYQKRDKLIRFILLGSAFAATGHLFAMTSTILMSNNWWLAFPPIYFTMIGIIFEVFFFNTGLGYKSKAEQEAKLRMQDELILQLEEKRKAQEQFLNMRNRLAADLHDEVGSTLSSIIIYSEVADKYVDSEPEKTHSILMRIRNSSKRVIDAMRDIVWATHSSDNEQLNWSMKLRETAHNLLHESAIEFYFEEKGSFELLEFLPEVKRNLLLVFREAISNSMKHSKCTRIDCRMSSEGNRYQLSISDNGTGFDNAKISAGIGLKNMKSRMQAIGGTLTIIESKSGGVSIQLNWGGQVSGSMTHHN